MIVNYRNSKDNEIIFWNKNPKYIPNINEKVYINVEQNIIIKGFVIDKLIHFWNNNKNFIVIDIIIKIDC